jgi:hypothetical protein
MLTSGNDQMLRQLRCEIKEEGREVRLDQLVRCNVTCKATAILLESRWKRNRREIVLIKIVN